MKAQHQRRLRQYHSWLGLFFAPAIMFFALTGTAQILGLHEDGPSYVAPAWIKPLANIHKHGVLALRAKPKPAASALAQHTTAPPAAPQPKPAGWARPFTVLLGLLLATSTALGIWIAFINRAARTHTMFLLAAGILVPIFLLVT